MLGQDVWDPHFPWLLLENAVWRLWRECPILKIECVLCHNALVCGDSELTLYSHVLCIFSVSAVVHGFPEVSYNVSEGETLVTSFDANIKGSTNLPNLVMDGIITSIPNTARMFKLSITLSISS